MVTPEIPGSPDGVHGNPLRVVGIHDLRIPVTNALTSKDWYVSVFEFIPALDLEEEQGVVGVVMRHESGFVLGLHQEPERAKSLRGFAIIALTVGDREQLEEWLVTLDRLGHPHGPIEWGHLGWYVDVPDPDGIPVRLHTDTGLAPDADEA